MANRTLIVEVDDELSQILVNTQDLDLDPGDTVTFQINSSIQNVTISGFASNFWTNTSSYTGKTSVVKTVRSDATTGTSNIITFSVTSFPNKNKKFEIRPPADYIPDSFTISNITNANPKGSFSSSTINVTGITRKVWIYVDSGSGQEFLRTVQATGASFSITGDMPLDYGQTKNITVYVKDGYPTGNTTYQTSFSVSTKIYPDVDEELIFPITSGTIKLHNDVGQFFGTDGQPARLTNYLRGQLKVPTIAGNEGVPTVPPIALTDFYGSRTGFYFIYPPANKFKTANVLDGAKDLAVLWNFDDEIVLGYGELAEDVEYRYEWTYQAEGLGGGINIYGYDADPTQWSQTNTWLRIDAHGPANVESGYIGTVTVYARNFVDPSLEISRVVNWSMLFYGP